MQEEKQEEKTKRNVNCSYIMGYLGLILCGSLIFGIRGTNNSLGYSLTIYANCMSTFKKMYNWSDDEAGTCLFRITIGTWDALLTSMVPFGAMVTAMISGKIVILPQ